MQQLIGCRRIGNRQRMEQCITSSRHAATISSLLDRRIRFRPCLSSSSVPSYLCALLYRSHGSRACSIGNEVGPRTRIHHSATVDRISSPSVWSLLFHASPCFSPCLPIQGPLCEKLYLVSLLRSCLSIALLPS